MIEEDEASGARGRYRIEPFMVRKSQKLSISAISVAGKSLELTQGFYKLTIRPDKSKGILSFVLHQKDKSVDDLQTDSSLRKHSLLMPKVNLPERRERYTLELNRRHSVATGIIVRSLPMDLSEPLPVILNPGQSVASLHGHRAAVHPSYSIATKRTPFLLITDTVRWPAVAADAILPPGLYLFNLKNSGTETALFTLKTVPTQSVSELMPGDLKEAVRASPSHSRSSPNINRCMPILSVTKSSTSPLSSRNRAFTDWKRVGVWRPS